MARGVKVQIDLCDGVHRFRCQLTAAPAVGLLFTLLTSVIDIDDVGRINAKLRRIPPLPIDLIGLGPLNLIKFLLIYIFLLLLLLLLVAIQSEGQYRPVLGY